MKEINVTLDINVKLKSEKYFKKFKYLTKQWLIHINNMIIIEYNIII